MRFLLLLILLLPLTAATQPYGFLTWSVEDGLPQSQVTALAEDERGYLWVGTNGGGVARFDGANFRPYGVADGLTDNFVRGLLVGDNNQLYALTRRGLAVMNADSSGFSAVKFTGNMNGLFDADAGAVQWGELQFSDDHSQITYATTNYVFTLQLGQQGWIVTKETNPYIQDGPELDLNGGQTIKGTRDRGLLLLNRGEPTANYTEEAGDLPHNYVLSLLKDRQGRAWIGTSGGGLVRMIPTGLRYFDAGDGLLGNRVYALHAARDGKLWISASAKGIQYLEAGQFQQPPIEDPTRGVKIPSITEDGAGRLYFATDGRGVVVLDSNRVSSLTRRSGLNSDFVLKVLPTGMNSVMVASYSKGLNEVEYFPEQDSFSVNSYGMDDGIVVESLSSIIPCQDGFLLGGTDGRIQLWSPARGGKMTGKEVRVFEESSGLPPGRVSTMLLRRGTQLWVAVQGYGLYYTDLRLKEIRFFPLPARFRKVSTNIFQLADDPNGSAIWLGTERGLTRVFLNADGRPDYYRNYGRAEGFLGGETTRDAVTVDSLGRLWFGTLNGMVRYEDDRGDGFLAPPPTFLERINLFYNPVQPEDYQLENQVPTFTAAKNHFQFRFSAVDLTYPDRLRYRFRLRGEEMDWSPLTDERAVRYAGLSPGRYTFLVAATTDGKTFGEPATYTFEIETPVIRSAWFLGLVTLLISGLVIGGSYVLYRRVQRKEAALREELETQNRLLELEQKARQLQMNPHFIFNALNSIRGLVDGNHDVEARERITKFATLMRGILNNSRQEMISLEEEVQVLREYIEMERFCQKFPIEYTIDIPDNIDPEEVSLPPMLLQPFVENAILHGLAGKEGGGRIDLSFVLRGRRMQCLVEDNGVGRRVAAERKNDRTATHKSVAVEVTGERLRASGGTLTIEDREGGGTRVEVVVPVEIW
ncbi:sensor histidine kinase [Neolewinella antarctica]|uniref:Ligand-binding sensor domain-containing protein/signal transduction histidine kinase n=1 Tax=Neolewinella antarctica TaxID=442734 RepID=A0ABX0XF02_9BACT|nr:two-component regulator propeller domain-containing protein [Neolewinella antarctica]NJC27317.1 ligand-binding sensor domain-containing protein/signal transduction histidine kinase [Neolewinella antarctica]